MDRFYPLRFHPLLRRYLWGGRRLETALGKTLPPGDDYAESWEVVDRPTDQSVVAHGPLAGKTLGQLVREARPMLLGSNDGPTRFPLLFKFLDAHQTLSIQVHPDDTRAARSVPPDLGKTEAWVVLACEPGSTLYAGLAPNVDRHRLEQSLAEGALVSCLHAWQPAVGDCLFIPAGMVHTLGAGLLVAEIQQNSDATYRLYDFDRRGADGKPRQLHIEQALEAIDFRLPPGQPQHPQPTKHPSVLRLVDCPQFVLDRWTLEAPHTAGGDGRFHLLAVIAGEVQLAGDPSGRPLKRGETALLPAACGPVLVTPGGPATLLDIYLP